MTVNYKNARYLQLILHELQSRNGGNLRKSQMQIQAMAGEDQRLLLELVRPYLNDIVIAAVENINQEWVNEVDEYSAEGDLLPQKQIYQMPFEEEEKSRKEAKNLAAHFGAKGLDKEDIAGILGKMRKKSAVKVSKKDDNELKSGITPPKSSLRQANMMNMFASAYKAQRGSEVRKSEVRNKKKEK